MSDRLIIRPARIGDREAILACQRAAISAIPVGYPYGSDVIAAWLTQPTRGLDALLAASRYFVAVDVTGRVLATGGWAPASEHGESTALLRGIFSHPDTRGSGAGREIVAAVELAARRAGFTTMRVPSAYSAVAFYRRLGYRVADTGRVDAAGVTFDVLLMDRRIASPRRETEIFCAASNDNRPHYAGLRV